MEYIVCGKKLVTVSWRNTVFNGAMLIRDGLITAIDNKHQLLAKYPDVEVYDYSNYVITPSLVDCHTHLLEFAPSALYPVTAKSHFIAANSLLFRALSAGITALGEQICGHPLADFSIDDYREAARRFPLDISFATTSISIGFEQMKHFSAATKAKAISHAELTSHELVTELAKHSDYPGENIFINATPANFTPDDVPRAGEIIYTLDELRRIVETFHSYGKQIGCHVAGEEGIQLALDAGFDVLHHAHGITLEQMKLARQKNIAIVATPIGGTHLEPNSPEQILQLMKYNIPVSISTDAYLPPFGDVPWLRAATLSLYGPDTLMMIANPAMTMARKLRDENEALALITRNPAKIMGKENKYGRLEEGLEANFIIGKGIPGLEITKSDDIVKVYYKGDEMINRLK